MPHHLLLADDSVTIQRVIKLTFADEDVDVTTVGDGDQAVAAIDKAPPDIVLADVAMPGRTGYDVAQHIRQTPRLAHIPVVLLTGAFEPVDEARAATVGCDAVLAKPFEPEEVVSRVRELLARPRPVAAAETPAPSSEASPAAAALPAATGSADAAPPAPVPPAFAPLAPQPMTAVRAVPVPPDPALAPAPSVRKPADIDAYFDRLDEAFATLAIAPRPAPPAPEPPRPAQPLSLVPPPALATPTVSAPSEAEVRSLVSAFDGLLAPAVPAVPTAADASSAASVPSPSDPTGPLSDADVERITDRVIEQLTMRLGASNLSDIVSQVAERLVRAEIEQIKRRL